MNKTNKLISHLSLLLATNLISHGQTSSSFSFINGTWSNNSQPGYQAGAASGSTALADGNVLNFSFSENGSSQATTPGFVQVGLIQGEMKGNLTNLSGTNYYNGFAFQQRSFGSTNNTSFSPDTVSNYLRLNFQFDAPIILDQLTLTDVDSFIDSGGANFYRDAVVVDMWSGTLSTIGSGDINHNTTLGSRLGTATSIYRNSAGQLLDVHTTLNSNNPTSQNDSRNWITLDSNGEEIQSFSLYYFNASGLGNSTTPDSLNLEDLFQTIGLLGSSVSYTTTVVPEPSSTALFGLGVIGLILRRRK